MDALVDFIPVCRYKRSGDIFILFIYFKLFVMFFCDFLLIFFFLIHEDQVQ